MIYFNIHVVLELPLTLIISTCSPNIHWYEVIIRGHDDVSDKLGRGVYFHIESHPAFSDTDGDQSCIIWINSRSHVITTFVIANIAFKAASALSRRPEQE